MRKYRIIEETAKSGRKTYYVQFKSFLCWRYLRQCRDITMHPYKMTFSTQCEAEAQIRLEKSVELAKMNSKVKKRKIINYEK